MKRASRRLRDQFKELRDLNMALSEDTRGCLLKFGDELAYLGRSSSDMAGLNFWLKAVVRVFFAHVDGVALSMRRLVLGAAERENFKLLPKEVAELSERRLDKASGGLGTSYNGKFLVNFKNAFRYFPKVFGSDWQIDLQSRGWSSFSRLLKARDSFTHPKETAELYRGDVGQDIADSISWFMATFVEMMKDVGDVLNADVRPVVTAYSQFPEHAGAKLSLIKPTPDLSSLDELLKEAKFMGLMRQDSEIAYDVHSKGTVLRNGHVLVGEYSEFGTRLFARFLFTEIEAFYYVARRLLEQSKAREEISFTEAEEEALSARDLIGRIASYGELFSAKFGYGRAVDVSGRRWLMFSNFAEFRDRITHPKTAIDLRVKAGAAMVLGGTLEWYHEFIEAIELSDKYINLPR
jgi:hypothetical protein